MEVNNLIRETLPEEIENKIQLYLSHPCADIIKQKCLDLGCDLNSEKRLEFLSKGYDLDRILLLKRELFSFFFKMKNSRRIMFYVCRLRNNCI